MDLRKPLIVFGDHDLDWSLPLRKRLRERGLRVSATTTAPGLMDLVRRSPPDLVVLGEALDELGGRMLTGLIQELSPDSRIIRVLPPGDADASEPGPGENVLCSVDRDCPEGLQEEIERVLCGVTPRRTSGAPLVMCVDDDKEFLRSLARVIRRQGYRVMTYSEPELALEELPLLKPDLLILDVLMPELSGFEVLDEVRRYYRGTLPVVLLSALDSDAMVAEGKGHGAAGYLVKPCPPETLMEALRSLLHRASPGEKAPGWTTRRRTLSRRDRP